MARTVQECNDYIVTNLVTQFASIGVTINPLLWSKRNFLRVTCYSFAIAQALFEQLADLSIAQMTEIQSKSAAATKAWVQDKFFKFQYSATVPQYVTMVNGIPQYPIVNESLRIVTACAVSTTLTNNVIVKLAKSDPLTNLSAGEITAAQDYIDTIGTAGINYIVQSTGPDRLYIKANIFYKGTYSAIIQTTVIDAINAYLLDLSKTDFNGYLYVASLNRMIKNIEGVNDVEFVDVQARYSSQSFGAGTNLIVAGDVVSRRYLTGAGYIIEEGTSGQTFADQLTFIAE
jgi:hypothetical protein